MGNGIPRRRGYLYKSLLILAIAMIIILVYPQHLVYQPVELPRLGDVARENVIAPIDFEVKRDTAEIEKEKQEKKLQAMHDTKDEIAWGSQIRSYVMHPYQMVKDHRINMEIGNVESVLDGHLDLFIENVLLSGNA